MTQAEPDRRCRRAGRLSWRVRREEPRALARKHAPAPTPATCTCTTCTPHAHEHAEHCMCQAWRALRDGRHVGEGGCPRPDPSPDPDPDPDPDSERQIAATQSDCINGNTSLCVYGGDYDREQQGSTATLGAPAAAAGRLPARVALSRAHCGLALWAAEPSHGRLGPRGAQPSSRREGAAQGTGSAALLPPGTISDRPSSG